MKSQNHNSLLNAAAKGDTATILQLIADGANINITNEKGWTPLVMAAFNQHMETVKVLVAAGADLNHQSVNGTTVFMYAKTKVMETGEYALLDYLLQKGAEINTRDFKKEWTVLQYVQDIGHTEMERYLIDKGASI